MNERTRRKRRLILQYLQRFYGARGCSSTVFNDFIWCTMVCSSTVFSPVRNAKSDRLTSTKTCKLRATISKKCATRSSLVGICALGDLRVCSMPRCMRPAGRARMAHAGMLGRRVNTRGRARRDWGNSSRSKNVHQPWPLALKPVSYTHLTLPTILLV